MRRGLLGWFGLAGIVSLVSYALAVVVSPAAYPGYQWMEQAVSDLSADGAPSLMLWRMLSAPYGVCSVVCATCAAIYVSSCRQLPRIFRVGVYLFCLMRWVSQIGYGAFPLADAGKDIGGFQEFMHLYVVTVSVVLLSIASLVCIAISGTKDRALGRIGLCAGIAFAMMLAGALGQGMVPPELFGVMERLSLFAAVGFDAVLGLWLFVHSASPQGAISPRDEGVNSAA